jgi:hypothetical protein
MKKLPEYCYKKSAKKYSEAVMLNEVKFITPHTADKPVSIKKTDASPGPGTPGIKFVVFLL